MRLILCFVFLLLASCTNWGILNLQSSPSSFAKTFAQVDNTHLVIDSTRGNVYVSDLHNSRVVRLDLTTGLETGAIGLLTSSTGTCASSGVATGWCTGGQFAEGTADGSFSAPEDLVLDEAAGILYVADAITSEIQKFDVTSGAFLGAIGNVTASTGTCPSSGNAPGWCSGGTFFYSESDGGFATPVGLALDSANDFLYVSNFGNDSIAKIKLSTGAFIGSVGFLTSSTGTCPSTGAAPTWCTGGTFDVGVGDGMFAAPRGLAVNVAQDELYVADSYNHRLQKLKESTGESLGSIGMVVSSTGSCVAGQTSHSWCLGGLFTPGYDEGMFNAPNSIAIDTTTSAIYVADLGNSRVLRYSLTDGSLIGAAGFASLSTGSCPSVGSTQSWCTGGRFTPTSVLGGLRSPSGVAINPKDHSVYVSNSGNSRIDIFPN